jgi:branched-chain amino acid transport system ATP-binding protein
MLQVEKLDAWYDRSHVVQSLTFEVRQGEIVTLMGRNGAGKTSTLRAIMGLMAKRAGVARFDGQDILAQPAHTRFHQGLAYVPEDRRIVPGLSVRENLRLGDRRQGTASGARTFCRNRQNLSAFGRTHGTRRHVAVRR